MNTPPLPFFVILQETVPFTTAIPQFRGVNRSGSYPATAGAYAAGITYYDTVPGRVGGVVTEGIFPIEVEPSTAIAVDQPISVSTTGRAIAGSTHVIGYAVDAVPASTSVQFIRVKLSA